MHDRHIKQRIDYIDTAKAAAITLVIIGHTPVYEPLAKWIYVFHIPLFFFISGYLFSFGRNPTFGAFVRKRWAQIAVPYAAVNIISYLFWLAVVRRYSISHDYSDIPLWQPIAAAVLGYATHMVHNTAMWFVGCLLTVETMYYALFRNKSGKVRLALTAAAFAAGWLNSTINADRLPLFAGQALMGLCFYAIGNEARRSATSFANCAVAVAALAATMLAAAFNTRIDSCANSYGNVLMYAAGATGGIYLTMFVCRKADAAAGRIRGAVRFVSGETMLICGFHLAAMSCIKGALAVCGYGTRLPHGSLWPNLLLSAACMAVCCTLIYAYRRLKARLWSRGQVA